MLIRIYTRRKEISESFDEKAESDEQDQVERDCEDETGMGGSVLMSRGNASDGRRTGGEV